MTLKIQPIEEFQGVEILQFENRPDNRGSLVFFEIEKECGFAPKRFFYLDDLANGVTRGNHAHKECTQVIFVMRGQADIVVDDGSRSSTLVLSKNSFGLLIQPLIWVNIRALADDSLIFVAASHQYDEDDYIRDRTQFEEMLNAKR